MYVTITCQSNFANTSGRHRRCIAKTSAMHCRCLRDVDKVFQIQKRAIGVVTKSDYLSTTKLLFNRLRTLNVMDMYKREVATFMLKYKHNMLPLSLIISLQSIEKTTTIILETKMILIYPCTKKQQLFLPTGQKCGMNYPKLSNLQKL